MKDTPSKPEAQETIPGELYGNVENFSRIFSLFIALTLLGLIAGVFIVLSTNAYLIAVILAISTLPILFAGYLVRVKRFDTAATFLGVYLLVINTVLSTKGLGIHSINNLAYPVILIIAGLVTSKRTMIFLTSLAVLCILWLVFGELMDFYRPAILVRSVPGDFFSASLILILTGVMVYRLTGSLFRSFSLVQKEMNERKSIAEDLYQREAILEAATFAAEQFFKTPSWRANIDLVLERLGKTLNVTHAYLFEDHLGPDGEPLTSMRHEWTASGYRSDLIDPYFQNAKVEKKGFEDQVAALKRGEVRVGNASTFNPIEKADMDSLGVKSLLEVPVFVNGKEWGAIGFDDFKQERAWTNAEIDALKIAAGVLAAAIQREIADSAVQESERIYRQAIEAAGAIPYYRDYVNNRYAFMGEGIVDITGYPASDMTPVIWKQMQLNGFPRGSMAHLTYEEADRLTEEGILRRWECDYRMINRHGQERWVSDSCVQVLDDRDFRIGVVGILQDVTDRKMIEAGLRQRDAVLEAVTFAAEKFLKSPDWRLDIDVVLERLGKVLDVTHTYLFEHHPDANGDKVSSLRYEWTAPGFTSDLDNPAFQNSHPLRDGVDSTDEFLSRGDVFVGNISTFPDAEKDRLTGLGIKAMVEMPLVVNGEWWGTIGFDDMTHERDWSAPEVDALKIAAGILSAAIQREMAESAVRESEQIYRQAISAAGAVPYRLDYDEDRYTFMGDGIEQIIGYKPQEVTVDLVRNIVRETIPVSEQSGLPLDVAISRSRSGIMKMWKADMRVTARNGEDRWLSDSAIEMIGEDTLYHGSVGILQDITDRKDTEARLRKRESILEAVTFAAEQFLKTSDWRDAIEIVLQRLGDEFIASHAYLFEQHAGEDGEILSSMIYEWTAPGDQSDLDNPDFQSMPSKPKGFERMYEILDSGEPLIGNASFLNEMEREYLHSVGVKALLEMRVSVNGRQWGTIGFDDTHREREWTSMEVDVIRVVVNVLGAAIQRQLDEDAIKRELAERRRTEQALRLSEEKFSNAFHSTPVFKTIEGNDHKFIDVNRAFLDGFGFDRNEVIGHTASELGIFFSPEDRTAMRQAEAANNGDLKNFEMRYRRRAGETGYVILSSDHFSVDNVEYTLTTGLDITERKQAEQKYRDIFNNSIEGIFQSTADGRFLSVNPAMARIYGFDSPEDMLDTVNNIGMQLYVNPEQRGEVRKRLSSGERLIGFETLDYRKDRSTFWATMSAQAIFDEKGNVLYYEGTVEDITPRKKADAEREALIAELAKKNAEAETLRETTSIVTSTLDKNEAVHRILEQLKRVVPYDSASVWLYEGNIAHLMGADGFTVPLKEDMWYFADETQPDYRFLSEDVPYILFKDVQEQFPQFREPPSDYIHGWLSVALKARGKLVGFISLDSRQHGRFTEVDAYLALNFANQVAVALENARLFSTLQRELDERKKLIEELGKKNAELEQFTYTVSHDLKSPLVTINGFLGYLEQDAFAGNMERLRKDIQRIQEAVLKMQRLLNELLELSRIGRIMNTPETVPFDELLREATEIVHGRLEQQGVSVHIQANLPSVYGDRPRLVEVLQNLIDNAAKYMGGQNAPNIEIGQRGEENDLPVFFVRDNGMGIPPEHRERIFGLFNKLDPLSEGTGVGLALVRRIIEVHGGRIWVESETGKGATFLFTLPTEPKPDSVI